MKMNFNVKIDESLGVLKTIRNRRGLKTSRKRTAVVRQFFASDRHYSAEELYGDIKKRFPEIGYSTVYRTLKLLVECGFAVTRQFEKGVTRFERVHPREHHDHMICSACGKIIEFIDGDIERLQHTIARKYLFTTVDHKLELYGYCHECRRRKRHG